MRGGGLFDSAGVVVASEGEEGGGVRVGARAGGGGVRGGEALS